MNVFWKIVICVLVCELLGGFSGWITAGEIDTWYAGLEKVSFNPPAWVFGPAWTLLYACMGTAFALVWHKLDIAGLRLWKDNAIRLFIIQFVLNLAWSFIFFGLHAITFALIEIAVLWLLILFTMLSFFRRSRAAGILLIPYWLWVSFAAVLTGGIFLLN